MPKPKPPSPRGSKPAKRNARTPRAPRAAATLPAADLAARPRATAVHLANEVGRLEAELAASRSMLVEAEARADIDPLLGILNRRGFERELARAIAFAKRYAASAALVYLDLDRFKPINDVHGHAAGDAVLRAVAAVMARNIRASDLIGRLGGDEFAILLWKIETAQAAAKAQDLEQMIGYIKIARNGTPLTIAASAGFVMVGEGDDPASLIARADKAMYARKRNRRASVDKSSASASRAGNAADSKR